MTSRMAMGRPIIYVSQKNKNKLHKLVIEKKLKSLDAALDLVLESWDEKKKLLQ